MSIVETDLPDPLRPEMKSLSAMDIFCSFIVTCYLRLCENRNAWTKTREFSKNSTSFLRLSLRIACGKIVFLVIFERSSYVHFARFITIMLWEGCPGLNEYLRWVSKIYFRNSPLCLQAIYFKEDTDTRNYLPPRIFIDSRHFPLIIIWEVALFMGRYHFKYRP